MNKNSIIFIAFIGVIYLLGSCEKDGNRITMLTNPTPPSFESFPSNLTFSKDNATNMVQFKGTPVNPGFNASATYILEACAEGNDFEEVTTLYSGSQDTLISFTVSKLNEILLLNFLEDQTSSVDFRIRAILTVDAGTGAPGTSTNLMEFISNVTNADVYLYGLPRLDLIGSGIEQKVVSPDGDGIFTQFVKLNTSNPFTLHDPETDTNYGDNGGALAVDGAPIPVSKNGWHKLTVNTNNNTYTLVEHQIGVVGDAAPNGWNGPNQQMDYNTRKGYWYTTIDLINGHIKFRLNDAWAWNLGGTTTNLTHGGADIPVTPGNYTIKLTVTNYTQGVEAGTFTMVKN